MRNSENFLTAIHSEENKNMEKAKEQNTAVTKEDKKIAAFKKLVEKGKQAATFQLRKLITL